MRFDDTFKTQVTSTDNPENVLPSFLLRSILFGTSRCCWLVFLAAFTDDVHLHADPPNR